MQKKGFDQVILTGFKTFGSHTKNPTEQLIGSITEEEMKAHRIAKKCALDVTCTDVDCWTTKTAQQLEAKPNRRTLIVHMGVGPNKVYYIEKCAYNNKDFRIPDNSGYQPCNQHICTDWDLDCPINTKLDVKELEQKLKKQKVKLSNDPGRYLCNYIYYCSMKDLGSKDNVSCLFVHFPTNQYTTPEQNKQFLLELLNAAQGN